MRESGGAEGPAGEREESRCPARAREAHGGQRGAGGRSGGTRPTGLHGGSLDIYTRESTAASDGDERYSARPSETESAKCHGGRGEVARACVCVCESGLRGARGEEGEKAGRICCGRPKDESRGGICTRGPSSLFFSGALYECICVHILNTVKIMARVNKPRQSSYCFEISEWKAGRRLF